MSNVLRVTAIPAAVLATVVLFASPASAQHHAGYVSYPAAAQPQYPGSTSYWTKSANWRTSLYPAPVPVPVNVGQVFYTSEPLYPHHYLHGHSHVYLQSPIKCRFHGLCLKCKGQNASMVRVRYSVWPF